LRKAARSFNRRFCLNCFKAALSIFLVLSLGAPWVSLQFVAWTTMLGNNLENHSFTEAFTQTFDGQHPCCLCKVIAAGEKSEKSDATATSAQKLEYPPLVAALVLIPPPSCSALSRTKIFAPAFFARPLLPPPRRFFV
jgi:hypothetical protein